MADLTVTFQGTSAAVPTAKRGLSAVTLQRGGDLLLFDCGEGTQRQMMKSPVGLKHPRAIFITHAHGDHWLGLPGLFATLEMMETREENTPMIEVYLPDAILLKIKTCVQKAVGIPKFVRFLPMELGRTVSFNQGTSDCFFVKPFKTDHTSHSQGYVFEEPDRPGKFEPSIAIAAGIRPGPDFGRLQAGETIDGLRPEDVIGPPRPGRKIVYTGDTRPCDRTIKAAHAADLLIHEATFESEDFQRAEHTRHSTGAEAGQVAAAAQPKRLALTHFSARAQPSRVVKEAAEFFSPVEGASDGYQIHIPLNI